MEEMTEKELEALIMAPKANNDARCVLGRLMVEGSSPKIPQNENKGFNWIKEASKAGHLGALEFKTYHDIRFNKKPDIEKITANLKTIIEKSSNSARACNILGEFNHAQASSQKQSQNPEHQASGELKAAEAAKYY